MKLLVLLCLAQLSWGHKREKGVIYENEAMGLRAYYPAWSMRSLDFPQPAPHTMEQTWRYLAFGEDGEPSSKPTALKFVCSRVYTPKIDGRNDCGEYALTLEDGDRVTNYCGETSPFTLITNTNDVTFTLKTGPRGGALVNCSVESIYISPDRREITTTTTTTVRTTVRPTLPSYLIKETEEVDSSEDGGAPGAKKTSCQCGWANKAVSRIVNGTETLPNEFPFAAGLVYKASNWRFCGATIVTTWHAITASHCTDNKPRDGLALLVGGHDLTTEIKGPTEVIPIEMIIMHQEYKTKVWKNDIALLVLEREIKFSRLVGPACLPTQQLNLENKYVKIIGWGADVYMGAGSPVLKKVNVRVVPMKECGQSYYYEVDANNPTQICTYRRKRASCQGDSGGPVVWLDPETNRYTHVGVVSFARICGDNSPSVHADVGAYLPWLLHFIKASRPTAQVCTKV